MQTLASKVFLHESKFNCDTSPSTHPHASNRVLHYICTILKTHKQMHDSPSTTFKINCTCTNLNINCDTSPSTHPPHLQLHLHNSQDSQTNALFTNLTIHNSLQPCTTHRTHLTHQMLLIWPFFIPSNKFSQYIVAIKLHCICSQLVVADTVDDPLYNLFQCNALAPPSTRQLYKSQHAITKHDVVESQRQDNPTLATTKSSMPLAIITEAPVSVHCPMQPAFLPKLPGKPHVLHFCFLFGILVELLWSPQSCTGICLHYKCFHSDRLLRSLPGQAAQSFFQCQTMGLHSKGLRPLQRTHKNACNDCQWLHVPPYRPNCA